MKNWQWEDCGETAKDWNAIFRREMIPLFSEKGHGMYLESPPSSDRRYFVSAIPVVSESVKVVLGMGYGKDVEEVFYIDFLMPNGKKLISPLLRIERSGNFLKPVPIVCGASPAQIRTALYMVVQKLNSQQNTVKNHAKLLDDSVNSTSDR